MKLLFFHLLLLFLVTESAFAQKHIWANDIDRKMRKIDNTVSAINTDPSLIQFALARNRSPAEVKKALPLDTLKNGMAPIQFKVTPSNSYFLKDSVVVKIQYEDQTFYFEKEHLILSYKRYEGYSDNTTQCCPITTEHFHYYQNNTYYKSFEKRNSPCTNPCISVMTSSNIDQKTIDAVMQEIKASISKK